MVVAVNEQMEMERAVVAVNGWIETLEMERAVVAVNGRMEGVIVVANVQVVMKEVGIMEIVVAEMVMRVSGVHRLLCFELGS